MKKIFFGDKGITTASGAKKMQRQYPTKGGRGSIYKKGGHKKKSRWAQKPMISPSLETAMPKKKRGGKPRRYFSFGRLRKKA